MMKTRTCGECDNFKFTFRAEGYKAGNCDAPVPLSAARSAITLFEFDNATLCPCFKPVAATEADATPIAEGGVTLTEVASAD